MHIVHPWGPLYNGDSKVLILGTIPSPKSREMKFYYGHPQNIFWKTLAEILEKPEPAYDVDERRQFLIENRIAAWDVLASCDIEGAEDSTIRNYEVNCFAPLLKKTQIVQIFATGKKAESLFNKHCKEEAGMCATYLPSTSPANRGIHQKPEFLKQWMQVREALEKNP